MSISKAAREALSFRQQVVSGVNSNLVSDQPGAAPEESSTHGAAMRARASAKTGRRFIDIASLERSWSRISYVDPIASNQAWPGKLKPTTIRIGTAGWAIPRRVGGRFPPLGGGLERYAARFNAVEINSTFYRPHRTQTYNRWAAATPADFRFSVKTPRTITHERRLADCGTPLGDFIEQIQALGDRLGPVLVQLPPSLAFDPAVAEPFFRDLRRSFPGLVACKPRHSSWFEPAADLLLAAHRVARAAADPARDPRAAAPGGWRPFSYVRLHGSPRVYYSQYGTDRLIALARTLDPAAAETWVIFDNTALGAAAEDALAFGEIVDAGGA